MSEAPNFDGTYPMGGERIGPAWQAAWNALAGGQWLQTDSLVEMMCAAGPIVPRTAVNLLTQARQRGFLEVRRGARRKVTGYRRKA